MKKVNYFLLLKVMSICCLLCISILTFGQQAIKHTISGYIEDIESSERLIGATVYDRISSKGTVTNEYGFFSLTLPLGEVELVFSYVGYQESIIPLTLNKDISKTYALSNFTAMDEIVITAEEDEAIQEKTQMSQMTVPVKQLKAMPVILGETDILKSLQLLPGVQSGGERKSQ